MNNYEREQYARLFGFDNENVAGLLDTYKEYENVKPCIQQYVKDTPEIGRNELCPCGSGKKYKKCCLAK